MKCKWLLIALLSVCVSSRIMAETTQVKVVVHTTQPVVKEDKLYLAGNVDKLGNWDPSGLKLTRESDTTFQIVVELEIGTEIEFKITRGTWETVEKDADGEEISNRTETVKPGKEIVVEVKSWADRRVRPEQSTVVGTLEIRWINSIEPARLVRVWLPAGYESSTQSYPVLYLLDGQNVFDRATSAINEEWGVDETLTRLIADKTISPLIVVAVDNSSHRVDEYTPFSDIDGDRKRGGHADTFASWLVEKLKPRIDREYRTLVKRESTWVGGSSLGGLFSLYCIVQHNETFGGAIAMSPSFGWGNESMTSWFDSSQSRMKKSTRVWVDFGGKEGTTEDDARKDVERFERFQESIRAIAEQQQSNLLLGGGLFPDAKHHEPAWKDRFGTAIQFITLP